MQRLIKFRIWDSAQNKYTNPTINYTDGRWFFFGNVYLLEEKGLILQQFTGLLDKNGKEIYEGDIVEDVAYRGEVKFYTEDIGSCGCCYKEFAGSGFTAGFGSNAPSLGEGCKIIGNIFETPELLK